MLRYSCYPAMIISSQAGKCQAGKCQAEDDAPPQHDECNNLNNLDNHTIPTPHRVQKDTDVEGVPDVFEELRQRVEDVISDEAKQCALLAGFFMTQTELLPDAMEALSPQEISKFVISLHELVLDYDAEDMSECEEQQVHWKQLQSALKPPLDSEQRDRLLRLYEEKIKEQKAEIKETELCYEAVKQEIEKLLLVNKQLHEEKMQDEGERDAQLAKTQACLEVVTGQLDSVVLVNRELGRKKGDAEKLSKTLQQSNEELRRLISQQELCFTESTDGLKNANTKWKEANAELKKANGKLEKEKAELEKANAELEAQKAKLKKAWQVESQDLTARVQRREEEMALQRDQHCNELKLLHSDLDALRTEQDKEIDAMVTEIYVSQQRQQEQQEVIDTLKEELQCAQQAQPANVTQAAPTAPISGHDKRLLQQLCNTFECHIACDIPQDPVLASDGHIYERASLEDWFTRNNISPITREPCELVATPVHQLQDLMDVLRQYEEHLEAQGAQPPDVQGAELQQLQQQLQDAQDQLGQLEQDLNVQRKVTQNLETQAKHAANQKKSEKQKNEAERVQLQNQIKKLTTAKSHIQAQIQAAVVQQTNRMNKQLQSQARRLQENEDDALHKDNMLQQFTKENVELTQANDSLKKENVELTQANANLKSAIRHIHQVSAQCQ